MISTEQIFKYPSPEQPRIWEIELQVERKS